MLTPAAPIVAEAEAMVAIARRTVLVEAGAATVIASGAKVTAAEHCQRAAGAHGEESNGKECRQA